MDREQPTNDWIGKSPLRREDPDLLKGQTRFVDDLDSDDALTAYFVRSQYAAARVRGYVLDSAMGAPGVVGVWTAADLGHSNQRFNPLLPVEDVETQRPLASGVVRYVGEPIAVVVAGSRYEAEDAGELVNIDYEPLPAVVGIEGATSPDAPLVHHGRPGNVAARFHQRVGNPETAFREAPHVIRFSIHVHRGSAQPLEPRGVLAQPEGDGLVIWSSTQVPHGVKATVAAALGLAPELIRVIAPAVGGGFGVKGSVYPEEVVVAWLAFNLRRPVKWIEDRRENFMASLQERDQTHHLEVAYNGDGRVLAVRNRFLHDFGAYMPYGPVVMWHTVRHIPGPYDIPNLEIEATGLYTNAVPTGPYRGAGRPQGSFVMERVIDRVAAACGMDPAEVRRVNLIRPEQMPHETGIVAPFAPPPRYDSGDYPAALDQLLKAADVNAFRRQQQTALTEGRRLGIGLALYTESTGSGPFEGAKVRLDSDGVFQVCTGATPQGQGHGTVFAQIAAHELGIDPGRIDVVTGDTAGIERGIGTYASRSVMYAGTAVGIAARNLRERLLALAAERLEAKPDDLELTIDGVAVKGAPGRSIAWGQLHSIAQTKGVELEAVHFTELDGTAWAYGGHAVVVEVDPDTGAIKLLRSVFIHDCGTVINPLLVEGQIAGGIAQAIGNTLMEKIVYDGQGQLTTASFMDYLLPTACEVPSSEFLHLHTPSPLNKYGTKGAGESGVMPVPAALTQAIEDAFRDVGAQVTRAPVPIDDVWRLANSSPSC